MTVEGVTNMPTDNPRITFTLSEEMRVRIDEFRFDNRIRNQTQAIVALLNRGLDVLNAIPSAAPELSPEDMRVLAAYHAAEPSARQFALEMLENHPAKSKERRA